MRPGWRTYMLSAFKLNIANFGWPTFWNKSLQHAKGLFSLQLYIQFILSLPLNKNRTILQLLYQMQVLSVFFQYNRESRRTPKMALFSVFHCNSRLWSVRGLQINNPGNCLASGCNFIPCDPCLSTALPSSGCQVSAWLSPCGLYLR